MSDTKYYRLANTVPVLCQITGYFTYGATKNDDLEM